MSTERLGRGQLEAVPRLPEIVSRQSQRRNRPETLDPTGSTGLESSNIGGLVLPSSRACPPASSVCGQCRNGDSPHGAGGQRPPTQPAGERKAGLGADGTRVPGGSPARLTQEKSPPTSARTASCAIRR